MEKIEQMISLYHTIFVCCLVMMILFLLIAVILFFGWRIRPAIGILTGRGAEKAITAPLKKENKKRRMKHSERKEYHPHQLTGDDNVSADDNRTVMLCVQEKTMRLNGQATSLLAAGEGWGNAVEMQMHILDIKMEIHSKERI